jgi:HAD superfamily hydrolase (TIGR01484 family)
MMKCLVLACDYDGTLAHDGVLDEPTAAALDRFRASGRRLVMVTGRELPDLQTVCKVLDKFEWIVAENGALLYRPSDYFSRLLCPSAALAQKLGEARAEPPSRPHAFRFLRAALNANLVPACLNILAGT